MDDLFRLSPKVTVCLVYATLSPIYGNDDGLLKIQALFRIKSKISIAWLPGGYSQKNLVGVCGPLPKTLTLFITKICDFPYPIYDLTKNLIPYL